MMWWLDDDVIMSECDDVIMMWWWWCQYTEDHGSSLGLSGWVKNTRQGTVIGQIQGPPDKVNDMWVQVSTFQGQRSLGLDLKVPVSRWRRMGPKKWTHLLCGVNSEAQYKRIDLWIDQVSNYENVIRLLMTESSPAYCFFIHSTEIELFYILLLMFFRKLWLKSVGSPSSRIDRAVFSNERDISKLEIHGFSTRYWTSSVMSHLQKTVTICCYSKWNWKSWLFI